MNISAQRWMPISVVLLCALYCCWPAATALQIDESGKTVQLVKWKVKSEKSSTTLQPERTLFPPVVAKSTLPLPEIPLEPNKPESVVPVRELVDRFQLQGVAIVDRQPWAVINNRLHAVGGSLNLDAVGKLQAKIVEIHGDRVLLQVKDETINLTMGQSVGRDAKRGKSPIAQKSKKTISE